MSSTLQDKLITFITTHLKHNQLIVIKNAIEAACEQAADDLSITDERLIRRALPQMRRYYVDDRLSSIDGGQIYPTAPKGEFFVVVDAGKLTISHIELHDNTFPRKAEHRTRLAIRNQPLEQYQTELNFEQTESVFENATQRAAQLDQLHIVMAIITDSEARTPHDIRLWVPYSDTWRKLHLNISLNELLPRYAYQPKMTDNAWPKLKAEIIRAEQESGQTG